MNTRNSIAEQVLEFIKLNSDRNQYEKVDIREVFLRMDQVANKYAAIGRLEATREGVEEVAGCYLVTFRKVPVLEDKDDKRQYVKLPSSYINITRGRGITMYDSKSRARMLINITGPSIAAYANSGASKMEGRHCYYIEGGEATFTRNMLKGPKLMPFVDIVMAVVNMADLDKDAPYPIDLAVIADFVAEVAAYFVAQTSNKETNINQ